MFVDIVVDCVGEDFQDQGGGFCQFFDKIDNYYVGVEGSGYKQW